MKRVLLITYYFPPSGGPGVQRGLKFARYLPDFGWTPTVLTVRDEDAAYPERDASLVAEVPPDLRVERTAAWDPYAAYARLLGKKKEDAVGVHFVGEGAGNLRQRLGRWVRANVFLPDARVGWVPYARRRAHALLDEAPFDAVLTTGPPHSTHLVGRALRHRLPWVADFRDPWTELSYYDALPFTPLARRLDAHFERRVLAEADRVVTVSPALGRSLGAKTASPPAVIPNGFDPADFVGIKPIESASFEVVHAGNLAEAQDAVGLWQALRRLADEAAIPRLRLKFVGNVDPVVRASLVAHGLGDRVDFVPYVPHDEAIRHMAGAAMLLVSIPRVERSEGIVTGKLFEYLAAGRPILGVGPPGGDAAAILAETGAGRLFAHADADGPDDFIRSHYAAWAGGTPRPGAAPEAIRPYSRRAQAEALAGVLESVRRDHKPQNHTRIVI